MRLPQALFWQATQMMRMHLTWIVGLKELTALDSTTAFVRTRVSNAVVVRAVARVDRVVCKQGSGLGVARKEEESCHSGEEGVRAGEEHGKVWCRSVLVFE
jgi:hypothetical protein